MNPPLRVSVDAPGAEMNYVGAGNSLAQVVLALQAGTAATAVIRNEDAASANWSHALQSESWRVVHLEAVTSRRRDEIDFKHRVLHSIY
jgi:hypothetical protein